jgi:dipeptidyl-peptidase-4
VPWRRRRGRDVDARQLPFRAIEIDSAQSQVSFTAFADAWQFDLCTEKLEPGGDDQGADDESVGVEILDAIRRSEKTGSETSLTFENATEGDIDVYWIDSSGGRRSYGTIPAGKDRDQHTFDGHVWLIQDARGRPLAVFRATAQVGRAVIDEHCQPPKPTRRPRGERGSDGMSPDGQWRAFLREQQVWIEQPGTGVEVRLTDDGSEEDTYRPPFRWSPDSRKLVVMQRRAGQGREIFLVESAPRDQLQPRLKTVNYAKPGDKISQDRPRLFDIDSQRRVDISPKSFPNPWSISEFRWSPDSREFTFLYNQRGHQVLRVVGVDAETGAMRIVVDEQQETFIDYAHKTFLRYLDETNELIWMSERDGWNHLYRFDSREGKLINQITQGQWVVRGVERVDSQARQIWFRAGGVYPEQDPYYVHLCRVNFDGSEFTILTEGDGTHEWEFSPDGQYLIDTWSRVDLPPVTELRDAHDGRLLCILEQADWSRLLETGWTSPERFVAKGRDGKTDIYGIIVRPSSFRPGRKYPVIEKIYAGPQSAYVPKAFGLATGTYTMAELGFIVVQIDGMGTSHRSKAFHDVCCRNLADAGFPDRIAWMRAAAETHPEMDLNRVGIYGGSAGGQNALGGLLLHPEFYKVGAADCGCHDNRMDKIWWNELWMGWPIGPHYQEQSNVTLADRLQGRLLLTVGELDSNVDPSSTMQVVHALIRADKDFELIVLPGAGHGAGEHPYAQRRRADFFVRHLLGREPRWSRSEANAATAP